MEKIYMNYRQHSPLYQVLNYKTFLKGFRSRATDFYLTLRYLDFAPIPIFK